MLRPLFFKHKEREMSDIVQIPRLDAVSLLFKLKHMKTEVQILAETKNQLVRKAVTNSLLRNISECHDGVNFHCQIKD